MTDKLRFVSLKSTLSQEENYAYEQTKKTKDILCQHENLMYKIVECISSALSYGTDYHFYDCEAGRPQYQENKIIIGIEIKENRERDDSFTLKLNISLKTKNNEIMKAYFSISFALNSEKNSYEEIPESYDLMLSNPIFSMNSETKGSVLSTLENTMMMGRCLEHITNTLNNKHIIKPVLELADCYLQALESKQKLNVNFEKEASIFLRFAQSQLIFNHSFFEMICNKIGEVQLTKQIIMNLYKEIPEGNELYLISLNKSSFYEICLVPVLIQYKEGEHELMLVQKTDGKAILMDEQFMKEDGQKLILFNR